MIYNDIRIHVYIYICKYRAKLGTTEVVLREPWDNYDNCKTDKGALYFRMSLRYVPNFVLSIIIRYTFCIFVSIMSVYT